MRNVTIVLAVAAVLALAGQAYGADATTNWQGPTGGTDEAWLTDTNWDNGTPKGHMYDPTKYTAHITNGETARVTLGVENGANSATAYNLHVGSTSATGNEVEVSSGYLDTAYTYVYSGNTLTIKGGTLEGRSGLHNKGGKYDLSGTGTVKCTYYMFYDGEFAQAGGTANVFTEIRVGGNQGHGTYNLSGGTLNARRLRIDGYGNYTNDSGTWNITNAPTIIISEELSFGNTYVGGGDPTTVTATLTADAGTVIYMTGSKFNNLCQNDGATGLAGLNNITFVFKGGLGDMDTFEVGGEDVGCIADGLSENFALEGLTLGTGVAGEEGNIQLVDTWDNHVDASGKAEALYVETLTLNDPGSVLDLNGKWLYYESLVLTNGATIANVVTGAGATGGSCQIPEPATLTLLGIGGLGVLIRRKRR